MSDDTKTENGEGRLAIVGMGALFPEAEGLQTYWSNLREGVDCIKQVPESHWRPEDYFDTDASRPDFTYAERGGFLPGVRFNPMEFGVSPNALEATDSAQLLGLMVARRTLEDAGYGKDASFDRSRASVVLGVTGTLQLVIPLGARLGHPLWRKALQDAGVDPETTQDVVDRISDQYVGWKEDSFPGLLGNVVAGRIANRLDLHGTNCVVDAACASSLSALHLAAMELQTGKSDLVITGGVDAFNDIFMYMCFSKTPALSASGNARPFDAGADGTILGEGIGMFALKRLADAERDNDRIYAVIRGIGSSSDGKGEAIYAPAADGQMRCLRNAYENAGVSPATVEMVEGHGTGTRVGDATEVKGLTEVFRAAKDDGTWCALGSVKSQIGHTKAAAGSAGILKAAMALHRKVLPPTIKVNRPPESLAAERTPFYVNTEKRPWLPRETHPRRAGVSSFGFGGSNFHCVLEEYGTRAPGPDWDGDVHVLPFSADRPEDLKAVLEAWRRDLPEDRADLRGRAAAARSDFDPSLRCRLVLVVERGVTDLDRLLDGALVQVEKRGDAAAWSTPDGAHYGSGETAGTLGILFPGQGSQYVGMLRDLACRFPELQDVLAEADRAFADGDSDHRLSDAIYPHPAFDDVTSTRNDATLRSTEVAQPAIGAVSLGALRVLESFGLKGDAVAGHSYGELLALHAGGRYDAEALHRLSGLRGRLMIAGSRDLGTMLAVQAPLETVEAVLREEKLELVVANRNAPEQAVVSGATAEVEKAVVAFERRSVRSKRLSVSAAFHSPLVAHAREPMRDALGEMDFGEPGIPVYSNGTAERYPDGADEAREMLAGQLAQPVKFVSIVENMHDTGVRTFVEVGPGSRLGSLVGSILKGKDHDVVSLDASSGRRSGMVDLGHTLARLAALGHDVDLARWDPVEPVRGAVEAPSRPAWTVDISGANYVKPKEAKPPRTPRPVTRSTETPGPAEPPSSGVVPVSVPTPVSASPAPSASPAVPMAAALPTGDTDALSSALELTRQNLDALQRMQQQAADMHRLFLEGQDRVRQSMETMLHGQLQALGVSMPSPVVTPGPAPAPVPGAASVVPSGSPFTLDGSSRGGREGEQGLSTTVPSGPGEPATGRAGASPAPTGQSSIVAAPSDAVATVLLEAVAEKTGYPVEMLDLDMGMDADLGIDSIKRVEILSAIQDRLPGLPAVKPDVMGSLRTLRDIVELLATEGASSQGQATVTTTTSPAAPAMDAGEVGTVLLEAVADRTGYPVEMLSLEMALDADLGIDSIKRVEILSNVQDRLPDLPAVKPDQMGTFRTLGDIVTFLVTEGVGSSGAPVATDEPAPRPPTDAAPGGAESLQRFVVRSIPWNGTGGTDPVDIPEGSEVWITDDGGELAPALATALEQRGLRPEIVPPSGKHEDPPAGLGGLVVVLPAGESCDGRLSDALTLLRRTGAGLRRASEEGGAFLGAVQRLDGAFGLGDGGGDASCGGLAGLLKTAAREWPDVPARAFDVSAVQGDLEVAASSVADGLLRRGPVETGIADGGMTTLETVAAPLSGEERETPALVAEDVVILSGGARGVTAACAIAIARRWKPRLVLLGRSPAPEEEEVWLAGLETEAAVKRALAERSDKRPSPKELEASWRTISAARAIRATLQRIEEAGAKAAYRQVDVRDTAAVARVLDQVREDLGPVRGVVHGAGVLADARIEDKTPDQFDRVYGTKVDGARALLEATREDDLRVLVMFSSTTARLGRVGQSDYAMANEVLNKMAQAESRRRPACRVMSLNWGPWEGGMVTPALARVFAAEGVGLIGLAAGADLLVREIATRDPGEGPAEVVVLGPDPGGAARTTLDDDDTALTTAFEITVDADRVPVLRSHVLGGRAVVPAALMVEWLSHGALHGNPGLSFHGLDELRVLKGVILDGAAVRLSVRAGRSRERDGRRVVPVELRGTGVDGTERLHARARVVLVRRLPDAALAQPAPEVSPFDRTMDEAYAELLFHGDDLRALTEVDGIASAGIVAHTAATPSPRDWIERPLRSSWLAEPMALDAAFQALILWSQQVRGAPSLPTGFAAYRQFRRRFPKEGVTIRARIVRDRESEVRSDIEFVDGAGDLVARMEGYDCVVDPSLHASFRERRLRS